MLNINDKTHTNTTIVSLLKSFKLASVYGKIELNELYMLSTVHSLLNTMCLNLTNKQRKQLISIYNKLAFRSKEVCTDILLKGFEQPMKNKMSQSFVDPDCIIKNNNINIWKTSTSEDINSIINTLNKEFLNTTLLVTENSFNNGYTIKLSNIGRFAFFINSKNNTSIQIFDKLDNNVTDAFDIAYVSQLNGVLIVSKLIYTSEPMFLKIV